MHVLPEEDAVVVHLAINVQQIKLNKNIREWLQQSLKYRHILDFAVAILFYLKFFKVKRQNK